jgi:hypothetical protein
MPSLLWKAGKFLIDPFGPNPSRTGGECGTVLPDQVSGSFGSLAELSLSPDSGMRPIRLGEFSPLIAEPNGQSADPVEAMDRLSLSRSR